MKASAAFAVGGVSLVGAVGLLALLSGGRRAPVMVSLSGTARDEEAIARMLASENPSGSVALWLEQIWTQIRSAGRRSLWAQITAGIGYGPETNGRPVATTSPPTQATRDYAARFLSELPPSRLAGARRFFEPAQQAVFPNLVRREDLVVASALENTLWSVCLALGSARLTDFPVPGLPVMKR